MFKELICRKFNISDITFKKISSVIAAVFLAGSAMAISLFTNAEGETYTMYESKDYLEYVVSAIETGNKDNFTILEIVPALDMGEMRYYGVGGDVQGAIDLINMDNDKLASIYNTFPSSSRVDNIYGKVTSNGMYSFGFYLKKDTFSNPSSDTFNLKMESTFLDYVIPGYRTNIKDYLVVNTVEANDLTAEDIDSADIIVITSGVHDGGTIELFKYLFGYNSTSYDKYGTKQSGVSNYNQYEMVDGNYVSRDISWEMVEKIWDLNKKGKELNTGSSVINVKIPVVMDNQNIQNLTDDTNIKRLEIILKMLTESQYDYIDTFIGNFNNSLNNYGILKGFLDPTKVFTSEPSENWINSLWNNFGSDYAYGSSNYIQFNPFQYSDYLSDDYWVYNGNSCLIPINNETVYVNDWSSDSLKNRIGVGATAAQAMEFLLGAADETDLIEKEGLKVLEIEPCNDFSYDDYTSIKSLGDTIGMDTSSWTSDNYAQYLQVVNITSSGFNGMNDDLVEEYDFIIIGDNSGIMTKDYNGNTMYNDSALDGYLYLAYGDYLKLSTTLQGAFESDYTYVGSTKVLKNVYIYYNKKINYDRTITNKNQLFADEFANARFSGNDITNKKALELMEYSDAGGFIVLGTKVIENKKCVFPTSNLYSVIQYINTNEKNSQYVLPVSQIDRINFLYENLNPEIIINDAPENLQYTGDNLLIESCINTTGILDYNFDINGSPNTSYSVKLIIDKNGDGIYSEADSNMTNDDNELFYVDRVLTDNTGKAIVDISVELPNSYSGLFSWKILITELDKDMTETLHRKSVKGALAINQIEKTIDVLQILPNGTSGSVTLNLTTCDLFKNYLAQASSIIGYNINIDAMTTDQFEDLYKGTAFDLNNQTATDQLKKYDMLILGFADSFRLDDISNENGAVDNIEYFIDLGKALLLTHDTIAYAQYGDYVNGTMVIPTYEEIVSKKKTTLNVVGVKNTTGFFCTWSYSSGNAWAVDLKALRERVGMNRYGAGLTGDELAEGSYVVPKNIDGTFISEIQGLNNMILYKYGIMRNYTMYPTSNPTYIYYPYNTYHDGSRTNNYNSQFQTKAVERLNVGQLTMYPFKIDEKIPVATTHSQWYQLNLELDDMVVWYTLTDDNNATSNSVYYGDTAKDASNNYYIYSRGNITYTGAGHNSELQTSPAELKLFVNTIIKAISAGNYLPEITVNNAILGNGGYVIYTDGYEEDSEYNIGFTATDNDLNTLGMVDGDMSKVGVFQRGSVSWVKDGVEVVIKNYGKGEIKNGIPVYFYLENAASTLSAEDYNKLLEEIKSGTAKFVLSVTDSREGTSTTEVTYKLRKLFELD